MKLLSVNVSLPGEMVHDPTTVETGIFKEPVAGRVMLREKNRGAIGGSGVRAREGRPE